MFLSESGVLVPVKANQESCRVLFHFDTSLLVSFVLHIYLWSLLQYSDTSEATLAFEGLGPEFEYV